MKTKLIRLSLLILLVISCVVAPIVTTSTNPYREGYRRATLATAPHVWRAESDRKAGGWTR